VAYPAQPAAIETLLAALQKLVPATRISPGELREHRTADADFGFDLPQIAITVTAADQRWQLQVGNRTAPGDQVFLRVIGTDSAFVATPTGSNFAAHGGRLAQHRAGGGRSG